MDVDGADDMDVDVMDDLIIDADAMDDIVKREVILVFTIANFLVRIDELREGDELTSTLTSLEMVTKLNSQLDLALNCSLNVLLVHIALRQSLTRYSNKLKAMGVLKEHNRYSKIVEISDNEYKLFQPMKEDQWTFDWNAINASMNPNIITGKRREMHQ